MSTALSVRIPDELASKLAGIDCFGLNFFEPLDKLFGVSRRAMSIQLVEHGFVT